MQSNLLPLLPQYQHWVDQWVLTQPEAEQPQEMELALQKLALHGLVDEETATRH